MPGQECEKNAAHARQCGGHVEADRVQGVQVGAGYSTEAPVTARQE
jgi:hypothetical protein